MSTEEQVKESTQEQVKESTEDQVKERHGSFFSKNINKGNIEKHAEKSTKEDIDVYCDLIAEKVPKLKQVMGFMKPFLLICYQIYIKSAPIILIICEKLHAFYQITPVSLLKAMYGISICFFGGQFVVSIAAVEAFNQCGGYKMKEMFVQLEAEFTKYRMKVVVDQTTNMFTAPQESSHDKLNKYMAFFFRSVDPKNLNDALGGIYAGVLAIFCVLKLRFARTIALSLSVAEHIEGPFRYVLNPITTKIVPKGQEIWVEYFAKYVCKFFALWFCWWIEVMINTVQSGIKGGLLFARNIMKYVAKKKNLEIWKDKKDGEDDDIEGYTDEMIGWTIAAFGIWYQFSHLWALPFPLNIFLIPLEIFEWVLRWVITWG